MKRVRKGSRKVIFALLLGSLVLSCLGCWGNKRDPNNPDARVRTLFDEWVELAQDPDKSLQGTRHLEIMAEMLSLRRDAFLPILDVFSNPDTPPKVRLLAHETLKAAVVLDQTGEGIVPTLIPLTESGHDPMVRACAMELLALTENPDLREAFAACVSDDDSRVRLAALCAQARLGDGSARAELARLYRETGLSPAERNRVLLELVRKPTQGELDIFQSAALDSTLPTALRSASIVAVGSVGGSTELPMLERISSDVNMPEDLRGTARGAREAIQNRLASEGTGG